MPYLPRIKKRMENGLSTQAIRHPALVLASLPDSFRMQLGPFNPQIQDVKGLSSLHSLNASAFRLRYGSGYPAFPAHLLHHLPPHLFQTVDPRAVPFSSGAFRPFNLSTTPKLYPQPSAFAPPVKADPHNTEKGQDLSPGSFVKPYDNEDESCFRSPSVDMDHTNIDLSGKSVENLTRGAPSSPPKIAPLLRDENDCNVTSSKGFDATMGESDASGLSTPDDERACKRPKSFEAGCPVCGQAIIYGELETHFSKEVERLEQLESLSRERKYLLEKVRPCFGNFTNGFGEENGISAEGGLPRGRWETYQRIKSNRLGRLRIKHRKRRNGDNPSCPVCNEKLQGSVEDINLHVEHCLKKHSETEEEEDENIDVEGDSESFGEYEWAGRHLARATTSFLVGGIAAGLLSSASSTSTRIMDKPEEDMTVEVDDGRSSVVSANQGSEDLNVDEDANNHNESPFLPKTGAKRVANGN